jgi:D-ornithine 4,5-aminomutase subunit alpha
MVRISSREDDFELRRDHLKDMSDERLKAYFWELAGKVANPLVDLARKNTSPSIERSVLLRMGFSDAEAKTIVDKTVERGLLGKGAGHVVFRLSRLDGIDARSAGLLLMADKGWDRVIASFGGLR